MSHAHHSGRRRLAGPLAAALLAFAGPLAGSAAADTWALVDEPFAYADGPLARGGDAPWRRVIGDAPIAVSGQAALIGPGDGSESYIARSFSARGLKTVTPQAVEARVTLRLLPASAGSALEGGAVGTVLQFTSANGKQRRGRLMFRVLPDSTYQLGVSGKGTTDANWAARTFVAGSEQRVVLSYEAATGRTRLWVDPDPAGAPGAPLVEATDPDSVPPGRVSLQVNSGHGPHVLRLDDLLIQPLGETE